MAHLQAEVDAYYKRFADQGASGADSNPNRAIPPPKEEHEFALYVELEGRLVETLRNPEYLQSVGETSAAAITSRARRRIHRGLDIIEPDSPRRTAGGEPPPPLPAARGSGTTSYIDEVHDRAFSRSALTAREETLERHVLDLPDQSAGALSRQTSSEIGFEGSGTWASHPRRTPRRPTAPGPRSSTSGRDGGSSSRARRRTPPRQHRTAHRYPRMTTERRRRAPRTPGTLGFGGRASAKSALRRTPTMRRCPLHAPDLDPPTNVECESARSMCTRLCVGVILDAVEWVGTMSTTPTGRLRGLIEGTARSRRAESRRGHPHHSGAGSLLRFALNGACPCLSPRVDGRIRYTVRVNRETANGIVVEPMTCGLVCTWPRSEGVAMSTVEAVVALVLAVGLWFCGATATDESSAPVAFLKLAIVLATGFVAANATVPIGIIGIAVAIFAGGYLTERGDRRRIFGQKRSRSR